MRRAKNQLSEAMAPERLREYYRTGALFWLSAIETQEERAMHPQAGLQQQGADVCLWVAAVQRLREIAVRAADRLHLPQLSVALEAFDGAWPFFKDVRDLLEHLLPPRSNSDEMRGVALLGAGIVDIDPDERVTYLAHAEKSRAAVLTLAEAIAQCLSEP